MTPRRTQGTEILGNLIDVLYVKGGRWRATCECGATPELFNEQRAAWEWVVAHECPSLEDRSGRPRHVPAPRTST